MVVTVIMLAGGRGTRMGTALPKQFLKLHGQVVARYSFDLFLTLPQVHEVIVVCDPHYRDLFPFVVDKRVAFAMPGERRQDSLYNALEEVSSQATVVCVHDAARPCLSEKMVEEVIEAAEEQGAAALGMPLKQTVKEVDEKDFVRRTVDRSTMWEVQTPQAVRRDLLNEGFAVANEKGITVTDDVALVELLGHPVKMVRGAYNNIKITTPEDLIIAEKILAQQEALCIT